SGIGKSTLVDHFARSMRRRKALVLAGRCYERETVPYKALDPIIDEVSHHLLGLAADEAAAPVPPDTRALAQIFPVLSRAEPVVPAPFVRPSANAQEQRRLAFAAARRLFQRLAERRPVVIHIDDVQWGDVDSALLIAEAFRPPTPALLLVVSYRRDEA